MAESIHAQFAKHFSSIEEMEAYRIEKQAGSLPNFHREKK